jgi:hypothetical protein
MFLIEITPLGDARPPRGFGHQLHQTYSIFGRDGTRLPIRFVFDAGKNQRQGHSVVSATAFHQLRRFSGLVENPQSHTVQ